MKIIKPTLINKFISHVIIVAMLMIGFSSVAILNAGDSFGLSKVVKVTASTLNVRSGAGTKYSKVTTLKSGQHKLVLGTKKDNKNVTWYKINHSSKNGYISSEHAKTVKVTITKLTDKKGTINISSGSLNTRTGPGTIYSKAGSIAKGKTVTLTGKAKDIDGKTWYSFTQNGKTVYVHSNYLKLTTIKDSSSTGTSSSSSSSTTKPSSQTSQTTSQTTQSSSSATTFKIGTVNTSASSLNVRSGAGTNYSVIGTLSKGSVITVLGSTKSTSGTTWYKFAYSSSKKGYVSSSYIKVSTVKTDSKFESYMKSQGFPDSYKGGLRMLHAIYPNWTFKGVKMGYSWNTALNAETSNVGRNLVAPTLPKSYRSTAKGAYNSSTGKWTTFDGRWYAANKKVVAYYMDPRNFINSEGIYQFMTHQYHSASQNTSTVKAVVKGTFMEKRKPVSDSYSSYASLINAAGKSANVNPNVIAAMIVQEQGTNGTSGLISGTYSGYKGYYNFFNIGAYTTSSMSAVQRGLWYAKQSDSKYCRPWNSMYKSIKGGALFYGNNYVSKKQDTYYYKKFNVKNGASKVGTHQYMTNVSAAASEGKLLKKAFAANPSYPAVVEIPIYNSMPTDACPLP